jgi:hypothetical protein
MHIKRCRTMCIQRGRQHEGGDVLSAGAWLGIFPASAINPPVTQDQVTALFAAEGLLAAFETV